MPIKTQFQITLKLNILNPKERKFNYAEKNT